MVLFPDGFDAANTLTALQLHHVTHFASVPSVLATLATLPGCQAAFASLHCLVTSGEALSFKTAKQLKAVLPASAALWNIYGCAETTADAMACQVNGLSGALDAPRSCCLLLHAGVSVE